ncbi:hypothetical protein [Micromonospora musae]|uniref:hypothetical protein n=1 Tax=Micromonospora musae TaxID=1894970 RepID=UPI003448E8B3
MADITGAGLRGAGYRSGMRWDEIDAMLRANDSEPVIGAPTVSRRRRGCSRINDTTARRVVLRVPPSLALPHVVRHPQGATGRSADGERAGTAATAP